MSDARIRTLELLAKAAELDPDVRIGQLVDWAAFMARPKDIQATRNVEDDELMKALQLHVDNLKKRDHATEQTDKQHPVTAPL